MTQRKFIEAAANGKLEKVKELGSKCDINGADDYYNNNLPLTALVASIMNQRWDVARFLLKWGARLEFPNHGVYSFQDMHLCGYAFAASIKVIDIGFFKEMLIRVDDINPQRSFGGLGSVIWILKSRDMNDESNTARLQYILYEAIIRSNIDVIEEFRSIYKALTIHVKTLNVQYLKIEEGGE